jgi:vesicle coat complex subunit
VTDIVQNGQPIAVQ